MIAMMAWGRNDKIINVDKAFKYADFKEGIFMEVPQSLEINKEE
jgi:hypothetical protein